MPLAMLKSFAEKAKKTEKEVEELWAKAKEIAKQEYPDARDAKYYQITTGILKKSLGLHEEAQATITTNDISNVKDSKKPIGLTFRRVELAYRKKKKKSKDILEQLDYYLEEKFDGR